MERVKDTLLYLAWTAWSIMTIVVGVVFFIVFGTAAFQKGVLNKEPFSGDEGG